MKKISVIVIVFVFLALTAIASLAAKDYVELARDESGVYSLDMMSVQRREDYVIAWAKVIPRGEFAKYGKKNVGIYMELFAINPQARQFQIIAVIAHAKDGSVLYSTNRGFIRDGGYAEVIPGSMAELAYDTIMYIYNNYVKNNNQ